MKKIIIFVIILMFSMASIADNEDKPIIQKEKEPELKIEPWMTNKSTWRAHKKMDRKMYKQHRKHYKRVKKEA